MPDESKKPVKSVRSALSLSLIQTLVAFVFSFAAITIISRLLTPAEIGVFSVAAGVLALVHMLRDFGVTEYLIQETTLDETMIRTVFTVNLIIAWVLAGIILLASGGIGRFFADTGVTQVLRVMSIVFFLLPFGTTTVAMLVRELEFGKLAKIRISESVIRSCTAVVLAYLGFSYMSMAWSSVVGISVLIVGCTIWGWQYRTKGFSLARWKRVLHFGSNRTVADIARQLGDQSANLVIGRMLGMADTGIYSRGYGVVNIYHTNFIGAIGSVAFPAFAREDREHDAAPELFLKSLVYTTGVSWPFFAAGILLAYPIINILFGNQWDAAVPLMQWLCGAALIGTLMYQCNGFLVALGRVGTVTRVEIEYQLARIGITIAAAFYSLEAVAAVQVVVYVIAVTLYYRELNVYAALSVRKCAKAVIPSAVVTLATCIGPAVVVFWPEFIARHLVPAFVVAFVGGGAGWLLGLVIVRHPLLREIQRVIARLTKYRHGLQA